MKNRKEIQQKGIICTLWWIDYCKRTRYFVHWEHVLVALSPLCDASSCILEQTLGLDFVHDTDEGKILN